MMHQSSQKHSFNYHQASKYCNLLALLLAYAILCLAVFLRAKRAVSPTIAPGVDLSIGLVSYSQTIECVQDADSISRVF